jgi:hypothetical protein
MKTILTFFICLFVFIGNTFGQIGLNDAIGSSHINYVKSRIALNAISNVENFSYSSGITQNKDSICITSNAYIGGGYFNSYTFLQKDRVHLFAGMNNLSQVNPSQLNYSKNVITVAAVQSNNVINASIHPKFDFAVNSCDVSNSCATSWAVGYATGLIDRYYVAPFIQTNGFYPSGSMTKSAALNSVIDDLLDTMLLKNQHSVDGILVVGETFVHNINLGQFYDSVSVTLFYYDRPSIVLEDTLSMNGIIATKNVLHETFYNTLNINISLSCFACDTFYNGVLNQVTYGLSYVKHDSILYAVPVELTDFQVTKPDPSKAITFLTWETLSETNNSHFEIERSTDCKAFEIIGIVNGNGNTIETNNYHYADDLPKSGDNYYRLKQVDFNGSFEYSEVRYIHLEQSDLIKYENNVLQVNDVSILFNSQGQVLEVFNTYFDVSNLSTGVFFVKSRDGSFLKFIKY